MTDSIKACALAMLLAVAPASAQPDASIGLAADERWASGVPLGGIGCGAVEVLTDGGLGGVTINNNWDRPTGFVRGGLMAVYAAPSGGKGAACLLRLGSADEFKSVANVRHVLFRGLWPEAHLSFSDDRLPVAVSVRAWSPLIPRNVDDSALPAAVFDFTVTRPQDALAADLDVSLLMAWPNLLGFGGGGGASWESYDGNHQVPLQQRSLSGLRFTTSQHWPDRRQNTVGDYFLAADSAAFADPAVQRRVEVLPVWDAAADTPSWWDRFASAGALPPAPPDSVPAPKRPAGAVIVRLKFPAGVATVRQRFLLAWFMPHLITEHKAERELPTLTGNKSAADLAIDGKPDTRWTMNRRMRPGERFELHLPKAVTAAGIVIDIRKSLNDWPRGLKISASPDGQAWRPVAGISAAQSEAGARKGLLRVTFPPTDFRFLRLEQLGRTDYWWWSLHELVLLGADGKPLPLAGATATAFFRDLGTATVSEDLGHWYERRFFTAAGVACYVADNAGRLWAATDEWRRPVVASSLPRWLKVKLLNDAFTMYSDTVLTRDGRFSVFESPIDMGGALGTMDQRMAAHAFYLQMFPELDESELRLYMRCQRADGRITHFCGNIHEVLGDPNVGYGVTDWPDLSCSFVLQVYKLALWRGDRRLLADFWPAIRSALSFLASADQDGDLLPEGGSTFDYESMPRGAFIYSASCYLGALLAGARAADLVGDSAAASVYRQRFAAVQDSVMRNLWNGRFFSKWSRPPLPDDPPGSAGMFIPNSFVASLAGDWLARTAALPDTLPPGIADKECAALIARHMDPFYPVPPMEVTPDGFLATSSCFFLQEEPYLGCELIYRGFVAQGLDVLRRNFECVWQINRDPWHQSLAYNSPNGRQGGLRSYMTCPASWHVLPALTGASADLISGTLYLSPRLPADAAELHVPIYMSDWWGWLDWVPGKQLTLTVTKTFKPDLAFTWIAADGNTTPIALPSLFTLTPNARLDLSPFLSHLHPIHQH
jgi:uncharacterized protein (DUF608 family)